MFPKPYILCVSHIFNNNYGYVMGNSMSNHPMISPTISDLSETLHTASPLLVYCILKVTAHSVGLFSRNSISNFQIFLRKFQNRTFLKFVPSKHFLITFLLNVQFYRESLDWRNTNTPKYGKLSNAII